VKMNAQADEKSRASKEVKLVVDGAGEPLPTAPEDAKL